MMDYGLGFVGGYLLGPSVMKSASIQNLMKKFSETTGVSDTNVIFGGAAAVLYLAKPLGEKANKIAIGASLGALVATMG